MSEQLIGMHQQKLVKIFSAVLAGENENSALLLHGQPGVGKTFILKEFIAYCEQELHPYIWIDWAGKARYGKILLLALIRDQLIRECNPGIFTRFDKRVEEYLHDRARELKTSEQKVIQVQQVGSLADVLSKEIERLGRDVRLDGFAVSPNKKAVAVRELTRVFCDCLNQLIQQTGPRKLVFLFDSTDQIKYRVVSYEQFHSEAGEARDVVSEFEKWLIQEFFAQLDRSVIVLASRSKNQVDTWNSHLNEKGLLTRNLEITNLGQEEADQFLKERGIVDEQVQKSICQVTGMNPMGLEIAVDWYRYDSYMFIRVLDDLGYSYQCGSQVDFNDFLKNLFNYLLSREEEKFRNIIKAAVLRRFTPEMLGFVFEDNTLWPLLEQFPSFLEKHADGYYEFHKDISRLIITTFVEASQLPEVHQRALIYYEHEADGSENNVEIIKNKLYHQFMLQKQEGVDEFNERLDRFFSLYLTDCYEALLRDIGNHFKILPLTSKQWLQFHWGRLFRMLDKLQASVQTFQGLLKQKDIPLNLKMCTQSALGEVLYMLGEYSSAQEVLEQALKTDSGDKKHNQVYINFAHWYLGRTYRTQGKMQEAVEQLEAGKQHASNHPLFTGNINCTLGEIHQMVGDLERALPVLEESVQQLDSVGERNIYGRALHILGRVYQEQGELGEKTRSLLYDSLKLRQELGAKWGEAYAWWGCGWYHLARCEFKEARHALEHCSHMFAAGNKWGGEGRAEWLLGRLSLVQGNLFEALQHLTYAAHIQDSDYWLAWINNDIGEVFRRLQQQRQAEAFYQKGLMLARETINRQLEAEIVANLLLLYQEQEIKTDLVSKLLNATSIRLIEFINRDQQRDAYLLWRHLIRGWLVLEIDFEWLGSLLIPVFRSAVLKYTDELSEHKNIQGLENVYNQLITFWQEQTDESLAPGLIKALKSQKENRIDELLLLITADSDESETGINADQGTGRD